MTMIRNPSPPVLRTEGGQFTVHLESVGNPDHGQNPNRPVYGVPTVKAHVDNLVQARQVVQQYINYFDLGGGNWVGGEVVRLSDGLVIGTFSYNGRLWADGSYNKEIEICPA